MLCESAGILHQTVASISAQRQKPAEILVVTPGPQHVLPETLEIPDVRLILRARLVCPPSGMLGWIKSAANAIWSHSSMTISNSPSFTG